MLIHPRQERSCPGGRSGRRPALSRVLLLLSGTILCSCERPRSGDAAVVVATNGHLASAARELLGPAAAVVSLAQPGTCPGHFDVRPSQARLLRGAHLLLRFDFQDGIDRQVPDGGPRVIAMSPRGGLCVPANYLALCRDTAAALATAGLLTKDAAAERLSEIEARLLALDADSRARVAGAGLSGTRVVASEHQADFCRALGLEVAGTLQGADHMTPRELEGALRDGTAARLVVANAPEGTDLADAVAARLGVPMVVFENFPGDEGNAPGFDALVATNVQRLLAAALP